MNLAAIEFLGLKKPYKIELRSKSNKAMTAGYYAILTKNNKLHSHLIRIYMGNLSDDIRSLETLIIHELIHAWQQEKGFTDIHGPSFQYMAHLISIHFRIPNLYLPDTDKP